MNYNLTLTESTVLIMIYEGKNIQEIAQWRNVPVSIFDEIVRQIMHKTSSNTWEELKIIGAQLASTSKPSPYFSIDKCSLIDSTFTDEESASIEYLANKWQKIPETSR